MNRNATHNVPSMFLLAAAIALVCLPAVSPAETCGETPQSMSVAPLVRSYCDNAKKNQPADDVHLAQRPAVFGGAPNDVFGAEITARDAMVEGSLDAIGTLTTLSAIPGGIGPGGSLVQGCDFDAFADFATLYCIEGSGGFFTFDTTTGAQALVGTASVEAPDGVFTGLASDPTTGIMYAVATSESSPGSGDCAADSGLYTVDLGTATATRVGAIPDLSCVIAAAFDNSGQLFAYGVVSDNLVAIDKATGASTVLGSLGFNANFAQGMDFDGSTNTCYLFAYNDDSPSGSEGELRTCDTTTGATSFVATLGTPGDFSEISGAGIARPTFLFGDGFETGDTTRWTSTTP